MSTRATVHFRRNGTTRAIVYRHSDGYPEGLGDDLRMFLEEPSSHPRFDSPTFLAARFVVWQETRNPGTGIGVVLNDPSDIEYRYLVECDGPGIPEIKVQSCKERLAQFIANTLRLHLGDEANELLETIKQG